MPVSISSLPLLQPKCLMATVLSHKQKSCTPTGRFSWACSPMWIRLAWQQRHAYWRNPACRCLCRSASQLSHQTPCAAETDVHQISGSQRVHCDQLRWLESLPVREAEANQHCPLQQHGLLRVTLALKEPVNPAIKKGLNAHGWLTKTTKQPTTLTLLHWHLGWTPTLSSLISPPLS